VLAWLVIAADVSNVLLFSCGDPCRPKAVAIPMIIGGFLLYMGSHVATNSGVAQVVSFTLIGFFMFMTLPLISTLVTDILPRPLAVPAVGLIGNVGNLFGRFVGPLRIGWLKQTTGGFSLAFGLLGMFGVIGGLFVLGVRAPRNLPKDRDIDCFVVVQLCRWPV
jgi:sugar phosphate permease